MELKNGIFWVGSGENYGGLHCNPYLIVDGNEAVLIDPGSVLDFDKVFENVISIVPIEAIKYVILHHQDPDLCSSVPLFENKGGNFKVVTHWRTLTLTQFYGIKSEYYLVDEHDYMLKLESGRVLEFVTTPFLHFPGAIATYDVKEKVLFSSDLFGSMSMQWKLIADEDYMESMKSYHEHYMPSKGILSASMEQFSKMNISLIAPQHGSVINKNVYRYIDALRNLECGSSINPVPADSSKWKDYTSMIGKVLRRLASIYGKQQTLDAITNSKIDVDITGLNVIDFEGKGLDAWNRLFQSILSSKGIHWLILIEPFVVRLSKKYSVEIPMVYESTLLSAEKRLLSASKELEDLAKANKRLEDNIKTTKDQLIRCPVTGLYNSYFYNNYLRGLNLSEGIHSLAIIHLDEGEKILSSYGHDELNLRISGISYILQEIIDHQGQIFRLEGNYFGVYMPETDLSDSLALMEKVRTTIEKSDYFMEKSTVSIGVASTQEYQQKDSHLDRKSFLNNVAFFRVSNAAKHGANLVCGVSEWRDTVGKKFRLVVADKDDVHAQVIKRRFEREDFDVVIAKDGEELFSIVNEYLPDFIISETMLQKLDALAVKERLLENTRTRNIPMLLVSHLKNEETVKRAQTLGIMHYLRKPYILGELFGIVKLSLEGDDI